MARLYEFQAKKLLKEGGIRVPEGDAASSPAEVGKIAQRIGKPVVLKIQVWLTGRAGLGGIQFAETSEEAEDAACRLFGMKVFLEIARRMEEKEASEEEVVPEVFKEMKEGGKRTSGFGHRIHTKDPRSEKLFSLAGERKIE